MYASVMGLSAGTKLGVYEVLEPIGAGGMGEVFRARDTKLNRDVALKVLPAVLAEDAERRMRFDREAQAVAALNHPNIITIHSVEQIDDAHIITMELVDGRTLGELIPKGGIPLDEMFEIAVPLADALAAAHGKGITHRDLKPENVMVTAERRVKVLDFGLAKIAESAGDAAGETVAATVTAEGKILGTIAYMSPEQAEGKTVDARSDVFSLGVLLYEMATGIRPFEGDTRISTLTAILRDTPPSLTDVRQNIPRHLSRIVNRCLAKEPERRYQSALDIRNELDGLRGEVESGELDASSVHSGIGPAPAIPAPAGRRIGPIVGIVAILALVVIGAVWMLGDRGDAPAPAATGAGGPGTGPVAVVGFENLGDPADAEQFHRMLVGLITTGLADSGGIEVVSSAKVMTSLKQAGVSGGGFDPTLAADAARLAGAGTMIVGQVMPADGRLMLTAELVDVASGNTIDSMRAEGGGKADLFAMASEIAAKVRGKLGRGSRAEEGLAIDLAHSLTDSPEAYAFYAAGELALHGSRFDEAVEQLTQAVKADPTFALAYYELGTAQFWQGDRAGALRNLHIGLQYIDRLPPRWQTTYQAAIDYETGSVDKAYAALEALVAESPEMPDPYNYLGEILTHYSKYQDIARARQLFARALELDPTYKVVLFHLMTFQLAFDDVEDARAVLERYRDDHYPSVAAIRIALPFHARRYADVVALEQDPRIPETLLENEKFMFSLMRDGEEERALELSTKRIEGNLEENLGYQIGLAYWYDGMLSFEAGEFRRALKDFSAAPPFFESPVVQAMGSMVTANHAQLLEIVGELDAAIDVARRGREVDHFEPMSRFETARLLFTAGRIEAGEREIEGLEALARESHSPYYDCWLTLARAARERAAGEPAAALEQARSSPQQCDPFVIQARTLLLARAAEDAGDLEQALQHFGEVANPPWAPGEGAFETMVPALYDVARLEQRLGKLDEARRHYREFLDHWGEADMPVPMVEEAKRALADLGG